MRVMSWLHAIVLIIITLIINTLSKFSTVFDGVWDFTHEDRNFRVYICSVDENNIYLSLSELWKHNETDQDIQYTLGVSHFDKVSESDKKIVLASSKSYVLSKRDDKRNKNGYFDSIFVLRYEKEEDSIYIHFKLTHRGTPTNIKIIRDENDDNVNKWSCWIPPNKRQIKKIAALYPQVFKAGGLHFSEKSADQFVVIRSKLKSGCWGWMDENQHVKNTKGGYFSSVDLPKQYDNNLMLFKWFDIGNEYIKGHHCKTGSGMFMIIGKFEYKFVGIFSFQCNDGKTGRQFMMELWKGLKDDPKYKCPLLTPVKTDL